MNPRDHAIEFLLPADPRHGIRSIAKRIWHAAATNDSVACKFATIQKLMGSDRPLIDDKHYELYERLKDSIPPLNIPTAPDWIRPAFAAAYLHAKAVVASGRVHGLVDNIDRSLDTVVEFAKKLEPSFVGELLAETVLAAHDDREFASTLTKAADEFRALASDLYGPDGTDRPEALAQRAGGGGADCTCCRHVGGTTHCAPCSCWVVVIIVIIIIVTKYRQLT